MARPSRTQRVRLLCAALLALGAATIAGCRSAAELREQADEEVLALVESRRARLALGEKTFSIDPPQDSLRQRILRGGVSGPVALDLPTALEIAAENSREYQSRKEALYLAALDLTLERWRFGWRAPITGARGSVAGIDDEALAADAAANARLTRILGTGATIVVDLGVSLARALTFSDDWDPIGDIGLSVTQPLLAGSSPEIVFEPLTQAERDLVYAVRTFERFRATFAVDVASRYYRLLQQRDAVGNQERNVESLVLLRERNEELARAGRLSDIDVGQARQDELSSKNSLLAARERLSNQEDDFKLTLGLPTGVTLELAAGALPELVEQGLPKVEVDETRAVSTALARRLDHLNTRERVADGERRVHVAEDALRAGLSIGASANLRSDVDDPWQFDLHDTSWSLSAALDLPIDRLQQRNVYRSALISLESARRAAEESADQIQADLREELRSLESRAASYIIQQNAVDLAKTRIESAKLKLEAGRADTRSLLEAQRSLLDAENALTSALVEYTLARLTLFRDLELLRVEPTGLVLDEDPLRAVEPAAAASAALPSAGEPDGAAADSPAQGAGASTARGVQR